MSFLSIATIFLFSVELGIVLSDVTVRPRNTAVIAGQRMELECSTNNQSEFRVWSTRRDIDKMEQTIFQVSDTKAAFEQFGVVTEKSRFDVLYSNSTLFNDAGTYKCVTQRTDTRHLVTNSAQLIVFESIPVCVANFSGNLGYEVMTKGQYVRFQCRVRFKGSISPTMQWTLHNTEKENETQPLKSTTNVSNTEIVSTLSIALDFPHPVKFSCRTYFPDATYPFLTDPLAARNVPEFEYIWSSSIIIIRPTTTENPTDSSSFEPPTFAPIVSSESPILAFVSENWVMLTLLGVVVCFAVIASVSFCACARARRRATAQRITNLRPDYESSIEPANYDAIDDVVVYSEIVTKSSTPDDGTRHMTSSGCSSTMRRLPLPPPVDQNQSAYKPKETKKGKTIERGRAKTNNKYPETMETIKSNSLPNLYSDSTAHARPRCMAQFSVGVPVYSNHAYDGASTAYLVADEFIVDQWGEKKIPSAYMGVNELSKRPHNALYPELDSAIYLQPTVA